MVEYVRPNPYTDEVVLRHLSAAEATEIGFLGDGFFQSGDADAFEQFLARTLGEPPG